jgi:DNA-binding CsgD family transcriptional regulator
VEVSQQLLGRGVILESLLTAVEDGTPILLDGEMGVGKSAVLAALSTAIAATGRHVANVFGAAGSRGLPLVPFGHLLAGWQPSNNPGQLALELLAEIERRATADRLVLLVDDVPYLDDASLAVVHQIAARASVPIVMTRRSSDALPAVLEELRTAGRIHRERLPALNREATKDLATRLAGAPTDMVGDARIWTITRGNPLFIRELIADGLERRHLIAADGVARWTVLDPATDLRRTVAARLDTLDTAERDAFRMIALFEAAPATQLEAGEFARGFQSLDGRGLIRTELRGRRRVVVPSHPLFAEVIRDGIGDEITNVWQSVSAVFESFPRRRADDVLQLALAGARSGEAVSVELLLAGAGVAMSRLAMDLVIELATAAQALRPTATGVALLGSAYFGVRDPERAAAAFKGALDLDASDSELADIAVSWTIALFFGVGDLEGTREVRDLFHARVKSEWRHQVSVIDLTLECYAGSLLRAAALARSVHAADDAPDRAVLWHTFPGGVAVCFSGSVRESLAMIERVGPFAVVYGASILAAERQLVTLRIMSLVCNGEVATSTGEAQRDLVAALEQNDGIAAGLTAPCLALAAWLSGEAPRIDLAAIRLIWQFGVGSWFEFSRYLCAAALARVGRVDLALDTIADASECMSFAMVTQHIAHAEIAVASGRVAEAIGLLDDAVSVAVAADNRFFQWVVATRLLGLRGSDDDLAMVVALTAQIDSGLADFVVPLLPHLEHGPDVAFVAGLRALRDAGYRPMCADLAAFGLRRCTNAAVASEVRALLTELEPGDAAPERARAERPVLSDAERRVANAVATGLTNRGVAQSLGISVKTVEFHMTSILRKLRLDSRSQLVRHLVGPDRKSADS